MNYTHELVKLIETAKLAVEETRAQVGFPDPEEESDKQSLVPSWLPELEAAIETVEALQNA